MNADEGGSLLVVVGVLILFVAIFLPRFLPFIPGNRWLPPVGPQAGRFGSMAGAGACIFVGLVKLRVIPQEYFGLVFVGCATVAAAAALYDSAQSAGSADKRFTPPQKPVIRNDPRRSCKRRKHRGRRR